MAILDSNPNPPPNISSVSNDAECTAIGDAKEPLRAQTDVHADYAVRVVKAKTIHPQAVISIKVIAAMGGLVPVDRLATFEDDAVVSRRVG